MRLCKIDLPWSEADSVYSNDGPDKRVEFDVCFNGITHRFVVSPINVAAIHSGRMLYEVRCLSCNSVLHEGTTCPRHYILWHVQCCFSNEVIKLGDAANDVLNNGFFYKEQINDKT